MINHRFAMVTLAATLLAAGSATSFGQAASLDDLLDLPSSSEDADRSPREGESTNMLPIDPELQRRLADPDAQPNLLQQVLHDMADVSLQLRSEREPEVVARRRMEDVLAKLDQLISQAEQQQQQQSSSGEGEPSDNGDPSSGDQSGTDSGSADNTAQGNQSQSSQPQQGNVGEGDEGMAEGQDGGGVNPSRQAEDPVTGEPIEEWGREWGNLPPRVRQELLEGLDERFSPIYRELTEAYYRRLAEEGR